VSLEFNASSGFTDAKIQSASSAGVSSKQDRVAHRFPFDKIMTTHLVFDCIPIDTAF